MAPDSPSPPWLAGFLGQGEVALIVCVVLILFAAREVARLVRQNDATKSAARNARNRLAVWLAQGLGVGRIPKAPGTFGSVLGMGWFLVLLLPGQFGTFVAGTVAGLGWSVWCCDAAERVLQKKDPGSVVLDEIAAIPLCFLPWVIHVWWPAGAMPAPEHFFTADTWWRTVLIFALFRLFDVWKPWPVRASQRLAGGWGVTVDDVLAAGYTALASLALMAR